MASVRRIARRAAKAIAKAPVHAYRWTLKPLIGWECRHLPTCSEYALEAIDRNGAWRGSWLALSRICRCHPWGAHGFDPVPDIAGTAASAGAVALRPLAAPHRRRSRERDTRYCAAQLPPRRASRSSASGAPSSLARSYHLRASARSGTTPCACRRASSAGS